MKAADRAGRLVTRVVVRPAARLPGQKGPRGHVEAGGIVLRCALGQAGITRLKREGDRATPAGRFAIRRGFFRPDRTRRPLCRIDLTPLQVDLGWCDDPGSPLYNRAHRLPLSPSHEVMWRQDELYDVVFVLDYNLAPRRKGRGSAIFLHCAKPGLQATLGCIALRPEDMRRLLPRLARSATLVVR